MRFRFFEALFYCISILGAPLLEAAETGVASQQQSAAAKTVFEFVKGRQSIFAGEGSRTVLKDSSSYVYFGGHTVTISGWLALSSDEKALLDVVEQACSNVGGVAKKSEGKALDPMGYVYQDARKIASKSDDAALRTAAIDPPSRSAKRSITLACQRDQQSLFFAAILNLGAKGGGSNEAGSAVPLYDIRVLDIKPPDKPESSGSLTAVLSLLGDEASIRNFSLGLEDQRITQIQEQGAKAESFRSLLKAGDESHCGLVIEVKAPIAQIQTQRDVKWMQIDSLFPKGARRCES